MCFDHLGFRISIGLNDWHMQRIYPFQDHKRGRGGEVLCSFEIGEEVEGVKTTRDGERGKVMKWYLVMIHNSTLAISSLSIINNHKSTLNPVFVFIKKEKTIWYTQPIHPYSSVFST
jgi:hypothetical protein